MKNQRKKILLVTNTMVSRSLFFFSYMYEASPRNLSWFYFTVVFPRSFCLYCFPFYSFHYLLSCFFDFLLSPFPHFFIWCFFDKFSFIVYFFFLYLLCSFIFFSDICCREIFLDPFLTRSFYGLSSFVVVLPIPLNYLLTRTWWFFFDYYHRCLFLFYAFSFFFVCSPYYCFVSFSSIFLWYISLFFS